MHVMKFLLLASVVCVTARGLLFKTDVALYSAGEELLWQSADYHNWGTSGDQFNRIGNEYPLCPHSPADCDGINDYVGHSQVWNAAGGNNLFNYLETHQYIIPAEFASKVSRVSFTVKTQDSAMYRVLRRGDWIDNAGKDWPSQHWRDGKAKPSMSYPSHGGTVGEPIHMSIVDVHSNGSIAGDRVLAMWLSFRSSGPCVSSSSSHCCHLTNKTDDLWEHGLRSKHGDCQINHPHYQCLQPTGASWTLGDDVGFINYVGSLNQMADGKPIHIHFDDGVDSSIPLTNSYAKIEVDHSTACSDICSLVSGHVAWNETVWLDAISNCTIKQTSKIAKAGLGPLKITGFGRVTGFKLMDSGVEFFGQQIWKDFDGTNAGSYFTGGVFRDHFKTMEWVVMSGLAELTSSDKSTDYAIDVSELTVAWGPKRGDGAILINAPYVALDDNSDSNTAARLWDVKTPGAWVDAADGPNLLGDGSIVQHAYLHHADDLVKVSASNVRYHHITALQGNIGSTIELGNYGDGLRTGKIDNGYVSGVYIHRVIHAFGGYDGNGGIFGTRTCPNGISFTNITVNNVTIPQLADANTVDQVFAIGALNGGAPFCSGNHGSVSFKNLTFHDWRVYVNPSMKSKMFGDGMFTNAEVDHVYFYDTTQTNKSGILASAVKIYDSSDHFYCICATTTNTQRCWDMNGPSKNGASNFDFNDINVSELWFPYGPAQSEHLIVS